MNPLSPQGSRRRDFLLMAIIGLLTIIVISVSAEFIARTRYYESATSLNACLDDSDPKLGVRGKPNTVCHEKSLESADVQYRLDARGYRSDTAPGPKPATVYRIVLIGSSVPMGERAELKESIAALLAPRLSARTGRKIEVYNEGMAWGFARNTNLRFQDALDVQPDLILWLVTPLDIARSEMTLPHLVDTPPAGNGIESLKNAILKAVRKHGGEIVIGQVLRHYLYNFQSTNETVRSYLQGQSADDESGFLRVAQGPVWQGHWVDFAGHTQDMFARARAAGIPMAVAFAPDREQAAMISLGEWPKDFDPYGIDERVRRLVEADGGTFIELLPRFREVPDSQRLYLPLDGHPTVAGYAFLSDALTAQLTAGTIPALGARAAGGS
jgi:hypothetical protein